MDRGHILSAYCGGHNEHRSVFTRCRLRCRSRYYHRREYCPDHPRYAEELLSDYYNQIRTYQEIARTWATTGRVLLSQGLHAEATEAFEISAVFYAWADAYGTEYTMAGCP